MMFISPLHLMVLVVLAVAIVPSAAWMVGDIVPMHASTLYHGEKSRPRELLQQHAPRFAVDRVVHVNSLDNDVSGGDVKVMFALGRDLGWRTSWLPIRHSCEQQRNNNNAAAAPCAHVREIHFEFTYEKAVYGRITGWTYKTEYSDHPQPHVALHYTWRHVSEYDLNASITVLCTVCSVVAVYITYRAAVTSRKMFGGGAGGGASISGTGDMRKTR
eukprot:PhM_4_TR15040/c0_g1_i1/m.103380